MKTTESYQIIERALAPYQELLAQTSDAILDHDISNYPIFVVHQQEVEIGVKIIEREEQENTDSWTIQASMLEEFVSKKIIDLERVEEFREIYKSPQKYFCLFILNELGAQFVFLPRITKTKS